MTAYINNPKEIEKRSFEIITEELGGKTFPPEIADIVKRVIHTTADFEYADLIEFKNNAVESGLKALEAGKKIYADTSMIKVAVNRKALADHQLEIVNYVHDEDVAKAAKERGVTRSTVGMEKALDDDLLNRVSALYKLIEFIKAGKAKPDLIVGAPIGFVGAAESKEALDELDALGVPYIRINGRKGGSPVVAAILNAMLYKLGRDW